LTGVIMSRGPGRRGHGGFVLVGVAVGGIVSAVSYTAERAAGFGTAVGLFVVSLPWSLLTVTVGGPLLTILGIPTPIAARVLIYALPVISGGIWGALVSLASAVRRGHAARNAPPR
jgi:hypothetical protein